MIFVSLFYLSLSLSLSLSLLRYLFFLIHLFTCYFSFCLRSGGDDSSCDLFKGQWITEESATTILYRPETCPILTQTQDCQGNGRPDNGYERWRWRPDGCELAPFDPRIFLSTLRGKTLAFAGDSVARNQMESLVCMLWQVRNIAGHSFFASYFAIIMSLNWTQY